MSLTNELISEHGLLVASLNKAKTLGINKPEGLNELKAAKELLLAHLRKEDDRLYPDLNKAAEKDANIKRILDLFAKDMGEIAKAALAFFAKHETGANSASFAADFGGLMSALGNRVRKEETILYKEYDKLSAK